MQIFVLKMQLCRLKFRPHQQEDIMLHTILFQDNPNADPDIRTRHMANHLDFLMQNKGIIQAAGPLKDKDGSITGGLWLVDVNSTEDAWHLIKSDPFWSTGLRDTIEVKQWVQVFAEGRKLL
jgi:uncharacterized protein